MARPLIPTYKPKALPTYKIRRHEARPDAAKRGYGHQWRQLRSQQPKGPCVGCGAEWCRSHHLDHIVPKSKGGLDVSTNLQWLCITCHNRKSAKDGTRQKRQARTQADYAKEADR